MRRPQHTSSFLDHSEFKYRIVELSIVAKPSRKLAIMGIAVGIIAIGLSILFLVVGPLYADWVGNHITDAKITYIETEINKAAALIGLKR
jgi:hypothetical protein